MRNETQSQGSQGQENQTRHFLFLQRDDGRRAVIAGPFKSDDELEEHYREAVNWAYDQDPWTWHMTRVRAKTTDPDMIAKLTARVEEIGGVKGAA